MTKEEASMEARTRWGDNGRIRTYTPKGCSDIQYKVGISVMGGLFKAKGIGASWEDAFARVKPKTPKKKVRSS